ncbi:cytochrome c-550, partial [Bacillus subtilis]|nr:cytochrome c-550 [Bacillus subtilis]
MKWNPLIPFLLIAVLGIGLTFFLSVKGLDDS